MRKSQEKISVAILGLRNQQVSFIYLKIHLDIEKGGNQNANKFGHSCLYRHATMATNYNGYMEFSLDGYWNVGSC